MALKAPGCLALLASVTPFLPGHTGFAPLLGQAKLVTISESLCLRFLLPGVHPSQSGPCPTLCPASPSRVPGLSSSSLCNIYLLRCSLPPRPPIPGDRGLFTGLSQGLRGHVRVALGLFICVEIP